MYFVGEYCMPVYEWRVKVMPTVRAEVDRIGGSSFLTEFGICDPDGDRQSINTVECAFVMRLADEYLQSWTYWDSQFFNDSMHGQRTTDPQFSSSASSSRSGRVGSALACRTRGPGFEPALWTSVCVFHRNSLQYAALGTGCTLTAVPRSTQPSTLRGTVNLYQPHG